MSDYEPVIDTLSEAEPDTERRLGAFPNPRLEDCPVVPLGFDDNKMIFAMPEGEIRTEIASRIPGMLRTDIFCDAAGQAFLTHWRDSEDKFQRELAAIWFNRKCREAGKWDTRRVSRSLGVWPGSSPAEVVLHKGDEILKYAATGEVTPVKIVEALRVKSGPLYKLFPPSIAPGAPCTASDGVWLRSAFDMWRFEPIAGVDGEEGLTGADVLAGWMMAALLGAVAPFRGHLLVRAMAGSGKTTLMMLVHAAISALAGELLNSFTDAGFRADIAGMARPIALDEAEQSTGDAGPGALEQVLNHLRLMTTGAGSNRKMSGMDGSTLTQTAVGSVIMAGILPPPLDTALATRVAEVKILPLNGSDLSEEDRAARPRLATDPEIAEATARAAAMAPGLLGRALAGAWRYREDAAAVKAAVVASGDAPRTADLVAMLAAGRRLLMYDAPLTPQEAKEEVAFWQPLLTQREATEAVSNPGADALGHLLSWDSGLHKGDHRATIGSLVAIHVKGEKYYDDVLKGHGIRIETGPGKDAREGPWLIVANHHPGLDRIFAKTKWKDHRSALEYLNGMGPDYAGWATKPLKFGLGVQSRGFAIPLAPWLETAVRPSAGAETADPRPAVPDSVPYDVPGDPYDF